MQIILDIQRFNPEREAASKRQSYPVQVEPTDRILDALMHISHHEDGSLAFRKSCAHGVCGSDAMRIAGKERLACKTLVRDVAKNDGDVVTIDPLKHMPIQKDLMVDQKSFLDNFKKVEPFLKPKEKAPEKGEYRQSKKERALIDDASKCISCGACHSACSVLDENPNFLGPMALVAAARFAFDSRDEGLSARLEILDSPNGVWACDNHFDCTKVCPRGIKITKLINFTKRAITKQKESKGEK